MCISGCQTGVYRAADLPPELRAKPVENARTLNLSKLTSAGGSSELLDIGDVIEISLASGSGDALPQQFASRIGEDGNANVLLVGPVRVAGLELPEAEQAIMAAAVQRGIYRHPFVTVTMKRQRTNRITVIGAVNKPSVYELPRRNSTLLGALVAADWLAEDAGVEVDIRRAGASPNLTPQPHERVAAVPGQLASYAPSIPQPRPAAVQPVAFRVNLASASAAGSQAQYLRDGDVVEVLRRDPKPVHVIGLINKPGQYDLPVNQELHLLDALAMAGGRSVPWANKVYVIRRVEGRTQPAVIHVNVSKAKRDAATNVQLEGGDIISVEQTPITLVMSGLNFVRVGIGGTVPLF